MARHARSRHEGLIAQLSRYLKLKVKRAVSYVGDFERAVAAEARSRGVHGVVCGHIHHAEIRDLGGALSPTPQWIICRPARRGQRREPHVAQPSDTSQSAAADCASPNQTRALADLAGGHVAAAGPAT